MDPQTVAFRQQLWERSVAAVQEELRHLPAAELAWIDRQLALIEDLQQQLHALFLAAGGAEACRDCQGACCARGTYHLTLANLLGLLRKGLPLPEPDFSCTCPLLGPTGCQLEVARRPYNCVSFICDRLEERLSADRQQLFYRLEAQLRQTYLEFAERYRGGSLHGLLNIAERLTVPFLQRRRGSVL